MSIVRNFVARFFILAVALAALPALADHSPHEVIERSTSGVINELKSLAVDERTEDKVREIVLRWIIPAIDEQRVAMGALGKHWRNATAEQRQAFIDLYREQQIRTYSGAFKAFDGEQINLADTVYNAKGDKAIVKTNLRQKDGREIPVDFRLYQRKEGDPWLVYDAVVAGLSLVKTYRDQLGEELQRKSLEAFLAELSETDVD